MEIKNGIKKTERYYIIAYYKPDEINEEKVKILDEEFIKINKNKCKIIYKNKIYELKEHFKDIDINYNHKDLIKLKIIFIHNIIDMRYMFYNCASLIRLSDTNHNCINYLSSQIISINFLHGMFYRCNSLKSLPDISKWDTSNIKNMRNMFKGVNSSLKLPKFYLLYLYQIILLLKLHIK